MSDEKQAWVRAFSALADGIPLKSSSSRPDYIPVFGDRVVGVLPTNLMRLWIGIHVVRRELGRPEAKTKEMDASQEQLAELDRVFSERLSATFPSEDVNDLRICKSWQVVATPKKRVPEEPFMSAGS